MFEISERDIRRICVENGEFLRSNQGRWEVVVAQGVLQHITEPIKMVHVMNGMLMLARTKVIIRESRATCDFMRRFSDSPKFEFQPWD